MEAVMKETTVKPRMATLGAYVAQKPKSLDPRKFPEEEFELFSVPSHADGKPEVVQGKTVGASKQMVEDDTVLLCKINPRINRTWVVSSHTGHRKIASSEWMTFPPHHDFLPKYLGYYLCQDELRDHLALNASGVGGSLMRAKPGLVKDYPFPLFPLPEQRRIVSAIETQLGRLDAAVARLHAAKAKLKRYKQAVLKAAYDEVAETYELKTFGELKEFSMYGPRFSSDDYTDDGVPVLRTSDIDDRGHVNMSTAPKLSLSKEQIAKYKLKLGDLLVTRTGSIGTVSVFNDSVDAIAGAFLIQYRLGGVDPWYAFHFLRGPVAQHHLIGNIAGIGRPNLNVAAIDSLELPVPPMKEQVAIRKTIEVKLNRVAELEATLDAQLIESTRLRQAVLKRAFEGRLV